jgi:flagellar FliL protein
MSDKPTKKSTANPAKKGGKSLVLIIVGVLILVGGGGAAAFYVMHKPAQPGHAAAPVAKAPEAEPGLLTLEPFTVNLADAGGSRFLRLSARLVVASPAAAEHAQKNEVLLMRVRSSILELLALQTSDSLVTPEGKTALKAAIAEHVNHVLEDTKVTDVLFSDFVVQF